MASRKKKEKEQGWKSEWYQASAVLNRSEDSA